MERRRRGAAALLGTALAMVAGFTLLQKRGSPPSGSLRIPSTPASPQAVIAGYETSDMDVRFTGRVLGGWAACVVAAVALLFLTLHFFHVDDRRPAQTPQQTAAIVPPGPHLQADPLREIAEQKARERAKLDGYRWTDGDRTTARIPIGRAMALVVGRSLAPPVASPPEQPASGAEGAH